MTKFNNGKPYHGSDEISDGKLQGATGETDYFYFFCPKCPDREIMRILEYGEHAPKRDNEYNDLLKSKAKYGFTLVFKLFCEKCEYEDFVKISNTGWQRGKHSDILRNQGHSCFISYSHKDKDFAKRLYNDLRDNGIRCWFAQEDMRIGDEIRSEIDKSIRGYDKLLIILTKDSVESRWVQKEVETAFEKEAQQENIVLFPIRLDGAVMETNKAWAADIRRTRHVGDFTNWNDHDSYHEAFERLLRDLKSYGFSI